MDDESPLSESAEAAIVAGLQAAYGFRPWPELKCDETGGVTVSSNNPWEWMTGEQKDSKREEFEMAYRAMAPLIEAGILRRFGAFIMNPVHPEGLDLMTVSEIKLEADVLADDLEAGRPRGDDLRSQPRETRSTH